MIVQFFDEVFNERSVMTFVVPPSVSTLGFLDLFLNVRSLAAYHLFVACRSACATTGTENESFLGGHLFNYVYI